MEQNIPCPNLPLWHVDCSEQKAIKTQQTQEKLFYLSLNCLKELYRGPVPESLGEGNGNPLQYSCLENSMDRGARWATVRGVAKSWSDWATNTVPERAITRDSFFYQKDISPWHCKHLLTNHLLFPSSELSPSSLKPQTPTAFSLAWDGIYASIARPSLSLGGDSVSM